MGRRKQQVMIRLHLWLVALLWVFWSSSTAFAQPTWLELQTTYFRVVYTPDDQAIATRYATIVDDLYNQFSTTFDVRPPTPLTLRLYPTSESYFTANPAARNVPGVIAHADFRRREVVVIVERARQQRETAQINNLRHELAHIFATDLSNGRLNVGLQEGIAQYMELPGPERDDRIATLRTLTQRGELWSWALLDDRNAIYGQPALSYPQTWSIVSFLIERNGFEQFRRFLTTLAESSGYRSAMAAVYGVSATTLESEWRAWLPGFLQLESTNGLTPTVDLKLARALLGAGDYSGALRELERLSHFADATTQSEIAVLQARAQTGHRANQLAEAARAALLNGEYAQAERLIGQAEQAYAEIGDDRQAAVLAAYRARVARGLQASAMLRQASEQARRFDILGAQVQADLAAREFAALGDEVRRDNALALYRSLARDRRMLAIALLFFGAAGIATSMIGRQLWSAPDPW
ncbi:MAG: hypothetical protein K6356_12265 [Chloroflexus sp.]